MEPKAPNTVMFLVFLDFSVLILTELVASPLTEQRIITRLPNRYGTVQTCNPSMQKTEAGRSLVQVQPGTAQWVLGHPGLHREERG